MVNLFRRGPGLAVLAVAAAGAAFAVAWIVAGRISPYALADPSSAGREELVRWLVVRDLAQESYERQRVLALRLDEEFFCESLDWEQVAGQLSAPQRQRLVENLVVLFAPWCREKSARFVAQIPEDREPFLEETLDRLELLARAGNMIERAEGGLSEALATRMLGAAEELPLRLPDDEAEQVQRFLDSLKRQWLVRQFRQRFQPASEEAGRASGD